MSKIENVHKLNILIVEDNPGDLFLLEETLRLTRLPFEMIYTSTSAEEAILILNSQVLD